MNTKDVASVPKHIAIVMDGNGRWAKARGLPRQLGHKQGSENIQHIIEECLELGVQYLTLYAFSTENWRRPIAEINYLMQLPGQFYRSKRHLLHQYKVRVIVIGDLADLPLETRDVILKMQSETVTYQALTLFLAFNYGSRAELAMAAQRLAVKWQAGEITAITEKDVSEALYTSGHPDPDLVIRCGDEMRLSNFLLWQAAYAELYFSPKLWPSFTRQDLRRAVAVFAERARRYGGIVDIPQEQGREDL